MKSNRQENHYEPCHRSLQILKERVEAHLKDRGATHIWFPDDPQWDKVIPSEDIFDIVVFGNFLRDFLESGLWPFPRVRLWCLSSVVQDYLEDHLLDKNIKVGLIKREDLFPIHNEQTKPNFSFVYAGRISESKNIPLLIELYYQLDQAPELRASLDLFGEPDNEISENYGRRVHETIFSKRLEKMVSEKKWNNPPVFHGAKRTDEWLAFAKDKTLISLSDYYAEDFGVAVAEAISNGTPVVISDWGGHVDVDKAYLKIPAEFLSFGIEDEALLKFKAQKILEFIQSPHRVNNRSGKRAEEASVVSSLELAQCRQLLAQKWGLALLWSQRVGLGYFADHDRGAVFMQQYNDAMAGHEICFEVIFIFTDIDRGELSRDEVDKCQKYIKAHPEKKKIHFLSERDLFKKDVLETCRRAGAIVYVGNHSAVSLKLHEIFGDKVKAL